MTRERAALGDDAAQFASAGDKAATIEDGDDDLLGGGGSYGGGHAGGEEITEFESSFPAMDTRNEVSLVVGRLQWTLNSAADYFIQSVGPGGTITGSNLPFQPAHPQPSYGGYGASAEEETEPIL